MKRGRVKDIALKDIKDSLPIDESNKGSFIFGKKLYNKEQRELNRLLGLHKINK